jgi:hypothetical protein
MQDQIPILVMVCPSRKQRPAFPYQCPGFGSQGSKSSHKIRAVCLIIDNLPLFNASYHHVVQRPWTIEPRMSRHIFSADSDPLCHLSSSQHVPTPQNRFESALEQMPDSLVTAIEGLSIDAV